MAAIKNAGLYCKPRKDAVCEVVPRIAEWLKQRKVAVLHDETAASCANPPERPTGAAEMAAKCDLLIVLGGDGTLLAAARQFHESEIPMLAVNLGGMGFMTSVTVEEAFPLLEIVLAGRHRLSPRMMLKSELVRAGKVIETNQALNDAVITKAALSRILDLDLSVDGSFLGRYRADGLIVSTPTGSTAYSLAAGGPILFPVLQAFVLTPICPHMLTNRPMVLPDSMQLEIDFKELDEQAYLTLDGQIGHELRGGDRIRISKSAHRVMLVRPQEQTYFKVLRNKLRWGQR
ncbi:MAG TPA: NAD(+)/NADH kinase [Candidatus Acidoferrales bacterium]|nr:NAD(+)/NADH kinase [Candidatus Acidoferrales bacterium]